MAQISVTIAATEELLTAFPVPQKPALKMSDLLAGPILSDPFDPPNPPLPCLQMVFIKISLRKTITKSRKIATFQNKRSMICEEVPYQILLSLDPPTYSAIPPGQKCKGFSAKKNNPKILGGTW